MATLNVPIAANGDDGYGWRQDSVFATAAGGGGTYVDSPGETVLTPSKSFFSPTYYLQVPYLRFNTAALGAGATVTAAKLQLYFTQKSITNSGYKMVGDYYDFGGEPSVAADWVLTSSPSIWTALDPVSITTGVVTDVTITNFTGINVTGYTGIRITMDAGGATPTGSNYVQFASYDNTSFQEPRLDITYTPAAGGLLPRGMTMGAG